jgi:hypothetical protein
LNKNHFSPDICDTWELRWTNLILSTDTHRRSPFLHACSFKKTDMTECLDILKNVGAVREKWCDRKGQFAVHIAMQAKNQSTLEWLHSAGFDFSVKTADGNDRTAAHIAVLGEYREGLRFLHWNARHVLYIKGEVSGQVSPIALCLQRYGKTSGWYWYIYHGMTLRVVGLPAPEIPSP